MANILNTGTNGIATSNPQANINQVQSNVANPTPEIQQNSQSQINPITIPIQIQPQVATAGYSPTTVNQDASQLQTTPPTQATTPPTPQSYEGNQANNVVNFDQIYAAYQSQYGNNQVQKNPTYSGVKKTSLGTTILQPTKNINTVQGQYQSAFSDTINGVLGRLLEYTDSLDPENYSYNPSKDMALRAASEYAANSTLQSLAGSGVLNSSATAERVARIVSELIPQYEQLSYNRKLQFASQLANTADMVMQFDNQQFQYWADAKDREFKEKEFEFNKAQKELENAWRRVDELGYVDNKASTILGVKVGTLSSKAREAKEQREFELEKMRESYRLEHKNNVAITKLKSELSINEMNIQSELDKNLYKYKSNIDTNKSKELADYQANIDKNMYKYKADIDTAKSKELAAYENSLNNSSKEYDYKLAQKYGATSSNKSSSNNVSLATYKDIIKNSYANYDDITGKYTPEDNASLWNYLTSEYVSGRMSENDYISLISMYGVTEPTDADRAKEERRKYLERLDNLSK